MVGNQKAASTVDVYDSESGDALVVDFRHDLMKPGGRRATPQCSRVRQPTRRLRDRDAVEHLAEASGFDGTNVSIIMSEWATRHSEQGTL